MDAYREKQRDLLFDLRERLARSQGHGTVDGMSLAPIKADHANDPATGLAGVSFLPESEANWFYKHWLKPLQELEPHHHFFKPEEMHITVKNIRKAADPPGFESADPQRAAALFSAVVPRFEPFGIDSLEPLCFPTSFAATGLPDHCHRELVMALDAGLQDIGLRDDKHYLSATVFFANITLCRFTRTPGQAFREALAGLPPIDKKSLLFDEIVLLTCNASCSTSSQTIYGRYALSRG